jgi:sec-independent protein translocase protein TatA
MRRTNFSKQLAAKPYIQVKTLAWVITMALIGYEWLIVVGILLVIFLWGPKKLPELAKSLGLAKKEFEKTKSEFGSFTTLSSPSPNAADESLKTAARNLGIPTEGRTMEAIAKDIADKTAKK